MKFLNCSYYVQKFEIKHTYVVHKKKKPKINLTTANFHILLSGCTLYFTLVHSINKVILKDGVIFWHFYLAKVGLRLKLVQNPLFSLKIFFLKIVQPCHDYIIRWTSNFFLLMVL